MKNSILAKSYHNNLLVLTIPKKYIDAYIPFSQREIKYMEDNNFEVLIWDKMYFYSTDEIENHFGKCDKIIKSKYKNHIIKYSKIYNKSGYNYYGYDKDGYDENMYDRKGNYYM